MKKFLINVTTYILLLCVLTIFINSVYVRLDKRDLDYTNKFNSIPGNIEVCNVGSSHGLYGYNYMNLEKEYTCFNFALVSQYPSYDYRLLDYYQDKLSDNCIVFINISYFSFIGKGEESTEDFASKNKRYYKILDADHIKQYDRTTSFIVRKMPALDAGGVNLMRAAAGLWLPEDDGHSNWSQTADEIDLKADVEAAYIRHLITDKLDNNGNIIINQKEIEAIYSIIDLCKKNSWIPILITTPFLKEYTDKAWEKSLDYMKMFYNVIDTISKNTGTSYYDYSLDKRFSVNHELFMNGDHMNQEGARRFVEILNDEIIEDVKKIN